MCLSSVIWWMGSVASTEPVHNPLKPEAYLAAYLAA
jgi:hypothetical protein